MVKNKIYSEYQSGLSETTGGNHTYRRLIKPYLWSINLMVQIEGPVSPLNNYKA